MASEIPIVFFLIFTYMCTLYMYTNTTLAGREIYLYIPDNTLSELPALKGFSAREGSIVIASYVTVRTVATFSPVAFCRVIFAAYRCW